MASLANILP